MISLRLKLVIYFLVLSLLPLAAAYWGLVSAARTSETRAVDERLNVGLRASLAMHEAEVQRTRARARALARSPVFQQALARRDRDELERLLGSSSRLRVEATALRVGRRSALGVETVVTVRGRGGALGRVIGSVPLGASARARLRDRAGLLPVDRLALTRDGRLLPTPSVGSGPLNIPAAQSRTVTVAGMRYRALVAEPFEGHRGLALTALSPVTQIEAAKASAEHRVLFGAIGSLLLIALVAFAEGSSIVRTVRRFQHAAHSIAEGRLDARVPVDTRDELGQLGRAFNEMADQLEAERHRLREATLRFGQALTATHDLEQLLHVIVVAAVEAARAAGGAVVGEAGDIVRVGTPEVGAEQLQFPLAAAGESFGALVLHGSRFSQDEREAAESLVAHAVVALENARLHEIVERQALVDGLTGLPNRRQCEQALATELSRAERFGCPLAFVVADIDGFKAINDEYGHPAGDRVLREFGDYLRESMREADVAARWGGEEFAILLPSTDLSGAVLLVERIRALLEFREIVIPDGRTVPVTASFGIAVYPALAAEAELIEAADVALYRAKRSGKNRVVAADEPLSQL
ncbi:MAG: diguanylate cyclase [Actinobacteria bacterium]|nr:diguanylate cyclase [Actinomycetota bacterium]